MDGGSVNRLPGAIVTIHVGKASAPAYAPYLHPCRQRRRRIKRPMHVLSKAMPYPMTSVFYWQDVRL